MTTKNIQDVVAEKVEEFEREFTEPHVNGRTMYARHLQPTERLTNWLRQALTEARQSGIDEAVEVVKLKKQDFTDHICRFNDSPQKCECYEKALDDTIKALQDKKQ